MSKGQASMHKEQESQASAERTIAEVESSVDSAPVGQASTHGAPRHERHTCGRSSPRGSSLTMRRRAVKTPNRPSCLATQAT
jgi:hypothetical protein